MKVRYLLAGLAGSTALTAGALGAASAASSTNHTTTNPNVGSSGIPRSLFRQDRLSAEAQVLNTSTTNVQTAHKNKTMAQLLKNANLTKQQFEQKVKAQLINELESQGYSQSQITVALQHKVIVHLRHQLKHDKN